MQKLYVLLAVVALAATAAKAADPVCKACQEDNEVYCESTTEYYFCNNNKIEGALQTCKEGSVCTNDIQVCVPEADIVADGPIKSLCGEGGTSGKCQNCSGGDKYACVSKTEYARCIAGEVSVTFSCNADEICVAEAQATSKNKTVCVPKCVADFNGEEASCANDDYTSSITTAKPEATPSPAERAKTCSDAAVDHPNVKWFYTATADCKSYVYCEGTGSGTTLNWTGFQRSCTPQAQFFDETTKSCVAKKPDSCGVPA
ncbi:CG33258 [Drosophila busckii]|uniref:CG33258 n=1 Tax=Drosophila busckii TaxID=30019 RepID=A0A0M4EFZ4_DROBS|nr:uncharacterized protein LOC108600507 [Drosophila busckii]ALC43252.1 CG33258 [Drosophila busckii]